MFHDNKLNTLESEFKENIESYHMRLDKISEDIKKLEKMLKDSGIGEFEVEISPTQSLRFEGLRIRFLDMNTNPCINRPLPLIEQKSAVRIEVAPYLPDLFEACLNLVKKGAKK